MLSNVLIKMLRLSLFLILSPLIVFSQQLEIVGESVHNYGNLQEVYQITSEFILKNPGKNKIALFRADCSPGIKVKTGKKILLENDTTLISVFFIPNKAGPFREQISVLTSASMIPILLSIQGQIQHLKNNDLQACYSFSKGKPVKTTVSEIPLPAVNSGIKVTSQQDGKDSTVFFQNPDPPPVSTGKPILLDPNYYTPNNLVFLMDVSGSMARDGKFSSMRKALDSLLYHLRESDRVTLITYADSVHTFCSGIKGSELKILRDALNGIKPGGYTRGNKAITFAFNQAIPNYIENGNNQVFILTDGKFPVYEADLKNWDNMLAGKQIPLSAVGIGNDKKALKELKQIAKKRNGSYVHFIPGKTGNGRLLEEIMAQSLKK